MDGEMDKFLCFTGISSAESKIRDDPCACKHESSDIENHISSQKNAWHMKLILCKCDFFLYKITVSIQNDSLLSFLYSNSQNKIM